MHSASALLTPHPDGIPRPARDVERIEGRQLLHRCQSDAQGHIHTADAGVAG
jgi:hypothetical protein